MLEDIGVQMLFVNARLTEVKLISSYNVFSLIMSTDNPRILRFFMRILVCEERQFILTFLE